MLDHQLFMTQMGGGNQGKIDFPYDPNNDNHYAMTDGGTDVLQCKISVVRISDENFEATITDGLGNVWSTSTGVLTSDGLSFEVGPPHNGFKSVDVYRTGSFGNKGEEGTPTDSIYGDSTGVEDQFSWTSVSIGNDNTLHQQSPGDSVAGGYCTVSTILKQPNGTGLTQTVECYYPCSSTSQ